MKGLACDFRVDGVKTTELRDYLRSASRRSASATTRTRPSCTSTCARSASAFWIDYSGPGEHAVYSENPTEDLKTGRADTYQPTKIDESWAADDTSMPGENAAKSAPPKDQAQASETPK